MERFERLRTQQQCVAICGCNNVLGLNVYLGFDHLDLWECVRNDSVGMMLICGLKFHRVITVCVRDRSVY